MAAADAAALGVRRFTRQDDGGLDTSYQGYHWNFNFQDGSNAEVGVNPQIEDIPEPFTINSSTRHAS